MSGTTTNLGIPSNYFDTNIQPLTSALETSAASASTATPVQTSTSASTPTQVTSIPSNASGQTGSATPTLPTTTTGTSTATTSQGNISPPDMRVRLSPLKTAFSQVLGAQGSNNILNPLYNTQGLMFPFSPQITVSQDINYDNVPLTHTNSDFLTYQKTPSVNISLSGKFAIQTTYDGYYALACLHFLRVVSKMYFGQSDPNRGLPPPILLLNGYGSYMFNNLHVILKSHSYTYNEQMDTVLVSTAGGTARLPVLFDIQLTLVVQQTPRALRQDFNLDQFRTGALLQKGGWI